MVFFIFAILPYLKYTFLTIDRHYFGFVADKIPPLVKGTVKLEYHQLHGLPHRTVEDVDHGHAIARERRAKGLPMAWEE